MSKIKKYVFLEIDYRPKGAPILRAVKAQMKIELGLKLKIVEDRLFTLDFKTSEDLKSSVKRALGDKPDVCILRTCSSVRGTLEKQIAHQLNMAATEARVHLVKYERIDSLALKYLLFRSVIQNENVEIDENLSSLKTIEQKLKTEADVNHEEIHLFRAIIALGEIAVSDLETQFHKESGFRITPQLHKEKGWCK